MRLIQGTADFMLDQACAAAIGKFDGIHRGHQELLARILKEKQYPAAVFTFDPPPAVFFGSGTGGQELTTNGTAATPPADFVREILVKRMKTALVVAGTDVTFGAGGRGDSALLARYGEKLGYRVEIIDKVCADGREISSSRIREALQAGQMEAVHALIGYPYSVTGTVVQGRQLGRTLGMPTVNLLPPADKLLPPCGVYFSYVSWRGRHYKSISNVGYKPTVSDRRVMGVETYLYDFDEDIYGMEITVNLLKFKRPEMKFDSVQQLMAQMQRDIAEGKR